MPLLMFWDECICFYNFFGGAFLMYFDNTIWKPDMGLELGSD